MFAVLGIVLLVAGAIITFAVDREAEGFDVDTIGWILIGAGALSLLIALVTSAGMYSTRSRLRTERHVSSDGGTVVDDVRVS